MVRSNFGLSLLEIRLDQERGIVLRSKNGLKLLMSRLSHQSEPVKFTLTGPTLHNETVIIKIDHTKLTTKHTNLTEHRNIIRPVALREEVYC